jgi:hypothetical protein
MENARPPLPDRRGPSRTPHDPAARRRAKTALRKVATVGIARVISTVDPPGRAHRCRRAGARDRVLRCLAGGPEAAQDPIAGFGAATTVVVGVRAMVGALDSENTHDSRRRLDPAGAVDPGATPTKPT